MSHTRTEDVGEVVEHSASGKPESILDIIPADKTTLGKRNRDKDKNTFAASIVNFNEQTDDDIVQAMTALQSRSDVTIFNLDGKDLSAEAVKKLVRVFNAKAFSLFIKGLDLSWAKLGPVPEGDLAALLQVILNSAITVVNLENNNLGAKTIEALKIVFRPLSNTLRPDLTLYLGGNKLGDKGDGLVEILSVIFQETMLSVFDLGQNKLGSLTDKQFKEVLNVIKATTLVLRANGLGSKPIDYLQEGFRAFSKVLQHLNIDNNNLENLGKDLGEFFKALPLLKSLSIALNKIGLMESETLAQACRCLPVSLSVLNLDWTELGSRTGAVAVFDAIRETLPDLEMLSLEGNKFSSLREEEFTAILRAIRAKKINLSYNNLGAKPIEESGRLLLALSDDVKVVNLSGNSFGAKEGKEREKLINLLVATGKTIEIDDDDQLRKEIQACQQAQRDSVDWGRQKNTLFLTPPIERGEASDASLTAFDKGL